MDGISEISAKSTSHSHCVRDDTLLLSQCNLALRRDSAREHNTSLSPPFPSNRFIHLGPLLPPPRPSVPSFSNPVAFTRLVAFFDNAPYIRGGVDARQAWKYIIRVRHFHPLISRFRPPAARRPVAVSPLQAAVGETGATRLDFTADTSSVQINNTPYLLLVLCAPGNEIRSGERIDGGDARCDREFSTIQWDPLGSDNYRTDGCVSPEYLIYTRRN